MATVTFTQTYTLVTCCHASCGVVWAMDDGFIAERRKDHEFWYCPNGHRQHYTGKNTEELLRQQLNRQTEEVEWQRSLRKAAEEEAQTERRRAAAARGQLTKIKNRIANGVCPVPGCRRSFTNVLSHLRQAHPDYHQHEENAEA